MSFSVESLQDLFAHMEWADARVWEAAFSAPAALGDQDVRSRLHHIHMTQRAFLDIWTGRELGRYMEMRFDSLPELYAWSRPCYDEMRPFVAAITSEQLAAVAPVPWARFFLEKFGREAGPTTLGETMFQATSHSHYHRGQVNMRLRALGVEPPLIDYIAWLWAGRPSSPWPAPQP